MKIFARMTILVVVLLQVIFVMSCNEKDQVRKNVLFIIVDDLRPELGCYDEHHIISPNIDALAADGIMFRRAYVQQAVCTASRASFLTGCRPDQTGVSYPYSTYFVNEFLKDHPTLQHLFFDNNFYTVTAGKVHHGGPGDVPGKDISIPHISAPGHRFYALKENILLGGVKGRNVNTPAWECADVADNAYRDGKIADSIVHQINRTGDIDQPFFIAVGFYKPHLPFSAPKKYWDLYDPDQIGLSPNPDHPENVEDYSLWHAELHSYKGRYGLEGEPVPDSIAMVLRHGYYACVSYIDAQVGKIITALKQAGQYENTVIVLAGDHGFHLGDHNNWAKHTNFEIATRAPLIFCAPGSIEPGTETEALVEFVDIFPTLTEIAGIEIDYEVEGVSMVPLFSNPAREWKTAAFSQYPRAGELMGTAIRTNSFRYVEWKYPDGRIDSRELYDHSTDPLESINVAGDETYEKAVSAHAEILQSGWKACLPPGIENHSQIPAAPSSERWTND